MPTTYPIGEYNAFGVIQGVSPTLRTISEISVLENLVDTTPIQNDATLRVCLCLGLGWGLQF